MSIESQRAADMLVHYFRVAFVRAGAQWNEDNETEVRGIVDDLRAHVDGVLCDHESVMHADGGAS